MVPAQELEVQQKRALEKKDEATVPARIYVPTTDIFETEGALMVVMEMPGVVKEHTDIIVEDNVLLPQQFHCGLSHRLCEHPWLFGLQASRTCLGSRRSCIETSILSRWGVVASFGCLGVSSAPAEVWSNTARQGSIRYERNWTRVFSTGVRRRASQRRRAR